MPNTTARLLAILAVLILSGIARGAGIELLSIETQAMLNDVVVVGTVTEIDGRRVRLSVNETIRGPDNTGWEVIWTDNVPDPLAGEERLFFISAADDGLRNAPHAAGSLPLDGSAGAYDISMRRVSSREDLLRAVRDVGDASAPFLRLPLPEGSRSDPRPRDDRSMLIVPKLRRLETLGRQWLFSDDEARRHTGLSAIAHFRSPHNVALLESLLSDMNFSHTTVFHSRGDAGRWKTGLNPLRERAWEVLQQWEVPLAATRALPGRSCPTVPSRVAARCA